MSKKRNKKIPDNTTIQDLFMRVSYSDMRTFAGYLDFEFSLKEQGIELDVRDYGYECNDRPETFHWWLSTALEVGPENILPMLCL